MKKIRLFSLPLAVLLTIGLMPAREAAGQLGASVGVNYSKLSDINLGSGSTRFQDASGWHAEVWFDMNVGPLSMRPGLRYVQAGSVFEFANDANTSFRDNFNVNMFEVPLDFRFRFNMEIATPYVAVGPVLRFPSAARGSVSGMKSMNVAGGFGVGLEMNLGAVLLYPELKFTFGITPFTEQTFEIENIAFTTDDNQQLNGVMLRLGIGFKQR
ncbi:MAG: outer membrane beta-barrel protein [Rhodothermales bacterium]